MLHIIRAKNTIIEDGLVSVIDARKNEGVREMWNEGGICSRVVRIDAYTEEPFTKIVDGKVAAAEKVEGCIGRGSEDTKGFWMRSRGMGCREGRSRANVKTRRRVCEGRKSANDFWTHTEHLFKGGSEEAGCSERGSFIFDVDRQARQICRGQADGRRGKCADAREGRKVRRVEVKGGYRGLAVARRKTRGAQQERK